MAAVLMAPLVVDLLKLPGSAPAADLQTPPLKKDWAPRAWLHQRASSKEPGSWLNHVEPC